MNAETIDIERIDLSRIETTRELLELANRDSDSASVFVIGNDWEGGAA